MSHRCAPYRSLLLAAACCAGLVSIAVAQDKAENRQAPPPANAAMQKVLDQLAALNGKPIESLSPEEARKQPSIADAALALKKQMGLPAVTPAGVSTDDRKVGDGDNKVPVRVYTPDGTPDDATLPVILYIHGGGWVIATNDTYDGSARSISKQLNAIVVSPEYRKAPEFPFPAAHEDVYATLQWINAHAKDIKGDANKVAVLGESAGGNMATAACLMSRDRGGKMPLAQVLIYPVASSKETPSKVENFNAKPLNTPMMKWFTTKTVQNPAQELKNAYLFPLDNADLTGLPPATVIGAQIDPLRDEGKAYADKLKAAGVDVEYKLYDGVTHEFFGLADLVPEAKDAQALAIARLQSALSK